MLNDHELEMACMLRMNRSFMYTMNAAYPAAVDEWQAKHMAELMAPAAEANLKAAAAGM